MLENGPSPLAMVALTLIIGGHMKVEDTPPIIKEEVYYYYPFIVGSHCQKMGKNSIRSRGYRPRSLGWKSAVKEEKHARCNR